VAQRKLGWDSETETGVVLHMVSALAVAGRIGLTAIGDTPDDASALYRELKQTLDGIAAKAAGVTRVRPQPELGVPAAAPPRQ
jgi:hypothetical protein